MELLKEIKKHEGFEPRVYKCTEGIDTIGYGFAIKDLYLANYQNELYEEVLANVKRRSQYLTEQ